MKNSLFLLGAAAVVALSSCTKNEVMEVAENRAIGFDAFVGNPTKADITDANIREFYVYGGYDSDLDNVFDKVRVYTEDNGTSWKYDDTQYWTANKTYTFQGYAPVTSTASASAKGVNFTGFVADGATDLLVSAVASKTTDATITNSDPIQLTFRHVLSKIKFKFTSDLDNVNITISDLKVNALPNTGTYTNNGTNGTWAVEGTGDYTLTSTGTLTNADDLTSGEAIVLPQTPSNIQVTFKVTATGGLSLEKTHSVTLPNTALSEGNVYVYTAAITYQNIDPDGELKPIVFGDPTVSPWSPEQSGGNVTF